MRAPLTDLPTWAKPQVLAAIVLGAAAIKLWVSAATGLVLDEAYYTLWSEYPSLGLSRPSAGDRLADRGGAARLRRQRARGARACGAQRYRRRGRDVPDRRAAVRPAYRGARRHLVHRDGGCGARLSRDAGLALDPVLDARALGGRRVHRGSQRELVAARRPLRGPRAREQADQRLPVRRAFAVPPQQRRAATLAAAVAGLGGRHRRGPRLLAGADLERAERLGHDPLPGAADRRRRLHDRRLPRQSRRPRRRTVSRRRTDPLCLSR